MERPLWLARLAYGVLIALAGIVWVAADNVGFAARPGTLGPDFWPKAALTLIIIVSLYEIARSFLSPPTAQPAGSPPTSTAKKTMRARRADLAFW